VIDLIDNTGALFERTPRVFSALGEEDLRDVILGNLNGVFEGDATGETFNKNGKTDIRLKIESGQILVAKCKIWRGAKGFHDTVEQLLSYLTWRESWAVTINFSRNVDFRAVLEEGERVIQQHPTYVSGTLCREERRNIFSTVHLFPTAGSNRATVYHIFFDLSMPLETGSTA